MKRRTDIVTFATPRKTRNYISLHNSNYCQYHLILTTAKVYHTLYKLDFNRIWQIIVDINVAKTRLHCMSLEI